MSLKAFHVIFISAAVVLAVWLGVWAWGQRQAAGDGGFTALAIGAFAAAAGLVVYEAWFLRKTRKVSSW
ncbi:MAG TPA: hypothetical protein VN923_01685 [Thermoanaerobaculia bacterium]|nr:hypothetical protein [Thermoanaerobaculia bacterium]